MAEQPDSRENTQSGIGERQGDEIKFGAAGVTGVQIPMGDEVEQGMGEESDNKAGDGLWSSGGDSGAG